MPSLASYLYCVNETVNSKTMRYFLLCLLLSLIGCNNTSQKSPYSPVTDKGNTFSINKLPNFTDFPIQEIVTQAPVPIALHEDNSFEAYKQDLIEANKYGPNFAGKYTLSLFGCGTGCQKVVLVDVLTGKVIFPNISTSVGASFQANSALFIANPPEIIKEVYGNEIPEWLKSTYYVWDGNQFISVFEP